MRLFNASRTVVGLSLAALSSAITACYQPPDITINNSSSADKTQTQTQTYTENKTETNSTQSEVNNTALASSRSESNTTVTPIAPTQVLKIGLGKAFFKSGKTGKEEVIGVRINARTNNNGHVVYDALWEDGYKSSYVFWSNGIVEIFSKDGQGKMDREEAKFVRLSNGGVKITTDLGSVTIFPELNPATN